MTGLIIGHSELLITAARAWAEASCSADLVMFDSYYVIYLALKFLRYRRNWDLQQILWLSHPDFHNAMEKVKVWVREHVPLIKHRFF